MKNNPAFDIIVAVDSQLGIGKNGGLPWHLPEDLKHFKEITCEVKSPSKKNAVIMGRKTWDSLPERFRPLPNRLNVVISRNKDLTFPGAVIKADSLENALEILSINDEIETIFVIGGEQIFKQAISLVNCRNLFITHLEGSYECDTFFPPFFSQFQKTQSSGLMQSGVHKYSFVQYARVKSI